MKRNAVTENSKYVSCCNFVPSQILWNSQITTFTTFQTLVTDIPSFLKFFDDTKVYKNMTDFNNKNWLIFPKFREFLISKVVNPFVLYQKFGKLFRESKWHLRHERKQLDSKTIS